jgi:hypothetical protein
VLNSLHALVLASNDFGGGRNCGWHFVNGLSASQHVGDGLARNHYTYDDFSTGIPLRTPRDHHFPARTSDPTGNLRDHLLEVATN